MNRIVKTIAIMVAAAGLLVACKGQYKKTDSGILYRFEKHNTDAPKVHEGDGIEGEMTLWVDTAKVFDNSGKPAPLTRVYPSVEGDLPEGLLMMHEGDIAEFRIKMDTIAKYLDPEQMPENYKEGADMELRYRIKITKIIPNEELEAEINAYNQQMEDLKQQESSRIADYIFQNNITARPSENGVYVVINHKGNGQKVATDKTVSMYYTGKLLDGTIFDSNVGGNPLEYVVGKMGLIPGWEEAVKGQPAGTKLTAIIPSAQGYGSQGTPDGTIQPYSPLVFEIEILSVK